jgi:taurine dioxygenase
LAFRDQRLTAPQMLAASRIFGQLYPQKHEHHIGFHFLPECPQVHSISNEDRKPDGTAYVPGNGWHIDHTNAKQPPKAIMLYAVQLPDRGGDTQFANLRVAYERLPDDMRRRIAGLMAFHTFRTADARPKRNRYFGRRSELPIEAVIHPLVCTHPENGRDAIYINPPRINGIAGLPGVEALNLLDDLRYRATRPECEYRHKWRPGDLVIWDNRCLLHRATDDYEMSQTRKLYRIMIKGEAPFWRATA